MGTFPVTVVHGDMVVNHAVLTNQGATETPDTSCKSSFRRVSVCVMANTGLTPRQRRWVLWSISSSRRRERACAVRSSTVPCSGCTGIDQKTFTTVLSILEERRRAALRMQRDRITARGLSTLNAQCKRPTGPWNTQRRR